MDVAFQLNEYGILTKSSYYSVFHDSAMFEPNYVLRAFVFEDIKTSNTFDKFKNYTKVNIPDLYDLVNSMGEHYKLTKLIYRLIFN